MRIVEQAFEPGDDEQVPRVIWRDDDGAYHAVYHWQGFFHLRHGTRLAFNEIGRYHYLADGEWLTITKEVPACVKTLFPQWLMAVGL